MALAYSLDKIGPMARAAEDCGLILSAIAGHDSRDRSSLSEAEARFEIASATPAPRLRVGRLTNAWKKCDPEIASAADDVFEALKKHVAAIDDAELPAGPFDEVAGVIISVEGAAAFRELIESSKVAELADPLGRVAGYVNEQIPASDYMRAQQVREICQESINALFDTFDVIAAPTLPVAASTLDTNLEKGLSFPDPVGAIGNLCGLPAISVPCGFTSQKLPIGVQFVARCGNERAVLAAANLYQQLTDWHARRPPIS
jgi:aspartyl-tRNA(Asn)/glutamyl-tRNA(Gln) amidotransferase subunit A